MSLTRLSIWSYTPCLCVSYKIGQDLQGNHCALPEDDQAFQLLGVAAQSYSHFANPLLNRYTHDIQVQVRATLEEYVPRPST